MIVVDEEVVFVPVFWGKESTESGVRIRGFSEGSERRAKEDEADVEVDPDADDRGVETLA